MTFVEYLTRQILFSVRTFGLGPRTNGVVDHIRKEISELLDEPPETRHEEWVDVVILALDGLWRSLVYESGDFDPERAVAGEVARRAVAEIERKLGLNESRKWPDWRTAAPDRAIEHVRENDR
jgi:hypothetical protein